MMKLKNVLSLFFVLSMVPAASAGVLADFDDLSLAADSYWSGTYIVDGTGGNYDTAYFNSGDASFENHSDGEWSSWAGFAYSNKTDTATAGFANQYSTYAGYAQSGSNFAIGYQDAFNGFNPTMILDTASVISGLYVTNTTYAGLAMLNGEGPAKQFGGAFGDDADWFMLTIEGFDVGSSSTGTVDFYLADYRFEDNGEDYIIDDWTQIELSSLGMVKSLEFTLTSSDIGDFGINTPTYFAMDTVVPEPTTIALLGLGGLLLRRRRA